MNISLIGNSALRLAIRRNLVSFPAQVPAFTKRPCGDMQERIAKLYFSSGWTVRRICDRYALSRTAVQKLISEWRLRAVAGGFIQDIHPEELEALVQVNSDLAAGSDPVADSDPANIEFIEPRSPRRGLTAFDIAAYNVVSLRPLNGQNKPSLRSI